jgi:hypothetical protein
MNYQEEAPALRNLRQEEAAILNQLPLAQAEAGLAEDLNYRRAKPAFRNQAPPDSKAAVPRHWTRAARIQAPLNYPAAKRADLKN